MSRASLVAVVACASVAWGQDAFEIQVYNADTAALGQMGFELHSNVVAMGNRALHLTLEPHVGLASWCEAGMYFLTALTNEGRYEFAGVKARFKLRWPEKIAGHYGLSLNQELSLSGGTFDPTAGFEWEIRPIIDADFSRAYFAVNPIIGVAVSGPEAGSASFEPAVKAGVKLTPNVMVGAEYYATIDVLGLTRGQKAQRLFAAFDADWKIGKASFELNAGVGYDFVGSDRLIAKVIFATDFQ